MYPDPLEHTKSTPNTPTSAVGMHTHCRTVGIGKAAVGLSDPQQTVEDSGRASSRGLTVGMAVGMAVGLSDCRITVGLSDCRTVGLLSDYCRILTVGDGRTGAQ